VEQRCEPMNKNRIRGIRRRASWQLTTKPISIKSAGCKFGGYAPKAVELTRRTRGFRVETMVAQLSRYLTGWRGYFRFCQTPTVLRKLEEWTRRRLRSVIWKQWKSTRVRFAELTKRGMGKGLAHKRRAVLTAHGD
jgi:hypothetical protein